MAEAPTMEVRARLTAETAQFTKGIENARKSVETLSATSNRLRGSILAIGVASGTATAALIAFGTKAFMAAARVDELDVALNAVGKSTGKGYKVLNETALAIKSMGVEMEVAQKSTLKYAQNNLDLSKAAEVARVAQDLAVIGAMNSTDAFDRLTHAIITGRSEVLKSVGIQKSAGQAYDEYAKNIGKTAKALSYEEKQAAILNMVLVEGARVAGTYEAAMTTPGKVLRSFARLHNDLQVAVGGVLVKAFGPMIYETYNLYKNFIKAVEGGGRFKDMLEAVQMVLVTLTTPVTNFIKGLNDLITKFNDSKMNIKAFAGQLQMVLPIIAALGSYFATVAGKQIFSLVPIFGQVLGRLNPLMIAFTALVATSSPLRNALSKLLMALQPLVAPLTQLAKITSTVASVGVLVLAKAVTILANGIKGIIAFVQNNIVVFKTLGVILAAVASGFLVYKAYMIAAGIAQAAFTAYTAIMTLVMVQAGTAMKKFNMILALNPILKVVGLIAVLAGAFIYLMKVNETFRKVVGAVFNFVVKTVITVFAGIVEAIGYIIKAFGWLFSVFGFLVEVVAKVFEFIIDAVITWYQFQLKAIKFIVDGFVTLMESHGVLYDVVKAIFNGIIKVITFVVSTVLNIFGNLVGGVADLVGVFNWLFKGAKSIFLGIVDAIAGVGNGIFKVLENVAKGIGTFLGDVFDSVTSWIRRLLNLFAKIPGIGPMVANALNAGLDATRSAITGIAKLGVDLGKNVFNGIVSGVKNAVNGIETIGTATEKTLNGVESTLKKMSLTVKEFGDKDNGAKIIEGMVSGAKLASSTLGTMIDALQKVKNFDMARTVGAFIDGIVEKTNQAGDFLIGLAASMMEFANKTDFAAEVGGAIGNMIESLKDNLKESLGFGDILAAEKEKFEAATGGTDPFQNITDAVQGDADAIKSIRQAMLNSIDGMKDIIQDLQQASKDFADSLKDTIMSFAGLKSVELPDGFIPKAKSLIENMQMRLNKSTQFANQIAQLHSMGLDVNSIKALLEEGPIKGAQLAASILAGGAEAIAQINTLQQGIEFTGAALGKYGADVAYGGLIANAQQTYADLNAAQMSISGATAGSSQVFVQQGAVQIVVDASMTNTAEEMADVVTAEINRVFGTLARELAAK